MRKKFTSFLIIVLSVSVLTSCSNQLTPTLDNYKDEINISSDKELEAYIEDNVFQYLERVEIKTKKSKASVYAIKDSVNYGTYVNGEQHGINLSYSISDSNTNEDEKSDEEAIESSLNESKSTSNGNKSRTLADIIKTTMTNKLASLNKEASEVTISDAIGGEDYMIQEIDYQIETDEAIYPCIIYIKADEIAKGDFLVSVIEVDNSNTDDDTEKMFNEILGANGIELG